MELKKLRNNSRLVHFCQSFEDKDIGVALINNNNLKVRRKKNY